jgi:predicted Abi (CAAX) family protease
VLAPRLRRAFTTIPKARDWLEAVLAMTVFAAVAGALGFSTGLLVVMPRPWPEIAAMAPLSFFIPALGEELLFRATIPDRSEAARAGVAIAGSVLAFTAWHTAETIWLPGAVAIFMRPDFLACAGLLGLTCAILRRRSDSIWTAVAVHWLLVVAWQGWFAGPDLAALG